MKIHYLHNLIKQGENQQLDFKFEISDAAKIARSLVAFANTDGGKLLIGVKDNGVIRGIRSDEEIYMLENAAQNYCIPEVKFTTTEWEIDEKVVLETNIPLSKDTIHKAPDNDGNYKAYVRVKDENLIANGVQMKIWKKRINKKGVKVYYSEPEELLLKYLRDHPMITINKFCRIANVSKYKAESILANFIILDIIEMTLDDSGAKFVISNNEIFNDELYRF